MTRGSLFQRLCAVADALEAECERCVCSAHWLALTAVLKHVDALIDEVTDHHITEAPAGWPVLLERPCNDH